MPLPVTAQVSELGEVRLIVSTGVTFTAGLLGSESPSVVYVTTVTEYVVPSVSPEITQVSRLTVEHEKLPDTAVAVAVYPVSVPVPKLVGAVHKIVAVGSPGVAITPVGAPGMMPCTGTGKLL